MQITEEEREILEHTVSGSSRNHFVASPGHSDLPILQALVAKGLMWQGPTPKFCHPNDMVFHVSAEGKQALAKRGSE